MKNPAQQCIKNLKKQGYADEEHVAIINALDKRLKQNARIFDRGFYLDLICEVMNQVGLENKEAVDTHDGRE